MTTTNNSSVQLPPLTNISNFVSVQLKDENYLVWKHQITSVFESLDLLRFIAVGTHTAFELWKKLEQMFLQQISAKKIQLQTRLHQIKQGTRKIDEYCDEISTVAQSLSSIGVKIQESDLVIYALTGLNQDYRILAVNIENSTDLPSFMELRSKLLVYEQRLQRETQDSSSVEVSVMAASSLPPHLGQNQSSTGQNRSSASQGMINLGNNCQICHKNGHMASKCFWRFDNGNNRGRGKNNNGNRGFNRGSFRGGRNARGGSRGGRSGDGNSHHGYGGNVAWQDGSFYRDFESSNGHFDPFSRPTHGPGGSNPFVDNSFNSHGQSFSGPNSFGSQQTTTINTNSNP